MRGLLAGRVPPEGPWELQGIELLSQNELYRQILLLLHLLPQDLLLPQVRPFPSSAGPWPPTTSAQDSASSPFPQECSLKGIDASLPTALPVFLLLLSGSVGPPHPVWAPGC